GHAAGQPAAMLALELHRIGKPAHGVAQRADRQLDQDLAVAGRVLVAQDLLVALPDLDAESQVVALDRADEAGLGLGLVEDVAGVGAAGAPPPIALGQQHPAAVVAVEADAPRALLRRRRRRRREGAFAGVLCRLRGRRRRAAGMTGSV